MGIIGQIMQEKLVNLELRYVFGVKKLYIENHSSIFVL